MSPFSPHRHPSIPAYLTMACGFAICVLYTELSTCAYLRRKKICWDAFQLHWNCMGYFKPGLKIFHHDSHYLFYVFMRPESRIMELRHRIVWNVTFEEYGWNLFLSKLWLFQTHYFLTQTKMTFPKLPTCIIPEVLCWYHARIAPLCWTAGDGRQWESTWSSVWSLGTLPGGFEGPAEDHGVADNQIGVPHEQIGISTLTGTKGAPGWGLHPSICYAV